MKQHYRRLALLLLLATPFYGSVHANEHSKASIEVILVEASNSGSGVDGSLSRYTGTLKRLFKFDSYQQVSRKNLKIDLPGITQSQIGNGNHLKIEAGSSKNGTLSAGLNWTKNKKTLLRTRLNLNSGKPAVLGGPRSKNGSYLLLIILK